jgi:hypothetical protein
MIEFPSIPNSSKAPRKHCVAFDKLDGSNFRAKYTQKQGFNLFGTRTQLIDKTTEFWGEMVTCFQDKYSTILTKYFKSEKSYRDQREIIVFGEFLGQNSFAGRHENEKHDLIFFDILVGHKNRKFVPPLDFVKEYQELIPISNIIYVGNLNETFIQDIRNNKYNLKEGVICKGTEKSGAYVGGIWNCKIKTFQYLEKIKELHKEDWQKYWE